MQVKPKSAKRRRLRKNTGGKWRLMKLIEEIILPNGLKLNIFDLSRDIAADTVKVEIAFKADIDLKESFFSAQDDYRQVKNIFGNRLAYEYTLERAYIKKEKADAVRDELITIFKNNSLSYVGTENFAAKLALSRLRDIKINPYKYSAKQRDPET